MITRRQPGNRIGLLLLGCSAVFALYGDATAYSVWDYHAHGGRLPVGPAAVVIADLWTAVFLVLPVVIPLFPDGRLPSRWRVVLWAYLADCVLITAIFVAGAAWQVSRAPIVVDGHGQLAHNPGPNDVPLIAFIVLFGAVPVFWVLFVARQVLSWRQASGERRAQLKWLMAGSAATVIGLAAGAVLGTSNPLLNVLDTICPVVGIWMNERG